MKTGILGGTFNPIHNGHLYMAFEAKETLELDQIIFVPNYIPPHKEASNRNPEDVLKMLELALEEYDDFIISTYELEKKGVSYTYETLEYFTKIYPHDELYFIIGEDSYVNFSLWKNPEKIISLAKLVVFQRQGFDLKESQHTKTVLEKQSSQPIILDSMILEISSSDIRQRVERNKQISYLVPAKVKDYIDEHGLYRKEPWSKEEVLFYLKNHLKESRLQHILGVVKAAKELAAEYGEDLEKAELAALYHDILKDKDKNWLVSYMKSHGEEPSEGLLAWKALHAPAGAIFAKEVCGQQNTEILNAVRFHTTGRANMTLLEKIIFVADYIEEGRSFPGVDDLRALARLDLDRAVLASLENSIRHLKEMKEHIMSLSLEAAAYYKESIKREDSK